MVYSRSGSNPSPRPSGEATADSGGSPGLPRARVVVRRAAMPFRVVLHDGITNDWGPPRAIMWHLYAMVLRTRLLGSSNVVTSCSSKLLMRSLSTVVGRKQCRGPVMEDARSLQAR